MLVFDDFSRGGDSLVVLKFEIISPFATLVAAVTSLLELPGAFVKCGFENVPPDHDIHKN